MQQLSGLDNSFLLMEAGGQLGHVGSLIFFDPEGLGGKSFKETIDLIETRVRRLSQ